MNELVNNEYKFGDVWIESGFHGIKYDFNNGARVLVPPGKEMRVKIIDNDTHNVLIDVRTENSIVSSNKKYYINFRIEIEYENEVYTHDLSLKAKRVLLVYSSRAIGDNIAWIPYAEEFRKKHDCQVYVYIGKHIRDLLCKNYPNLIFLDEEDLPKLKFYATYYVGVFFPVSDRNHQPIDFRFLGLQKSIAMILGLAPIELKAHLKSESVKSIKEPYVCIAVQSTTQCKTWNNTAGWIEVIEYLKSLGYRVLCIDKEKTYRVGRIINTIPFGAEDFTGDIPLQERVDLLKHADFFIGGSSGLAWVAWATGIPVIMIGGFTLPFNEFYTPYRIINYNVCNGCWHEIEFKNDDYGWCPRYKNTEREFECSRSISSKQVIDMINKLRGNKS